MTMTRSDKWSWTDDVLPFVAMLLLICLDMAVLTIVKAAMNGGMESIVYVIYHNSLGTLILLPFFVAHMFRKVGRPPLTFHILFRFFILGLFGLCCFQVLVFVGVNYSSPTLASAITNLIPGNTFLFAVVFGMEKINLRSSSSRAKLLGTIIAISGAMVFTFYQGPTLLTTTPSSDSPNHLPLSQPSNWVFGGSIILIAGIFRSIYYVLQTATVREFPDQQTVVFFYCLFGTIQCIALSPFLVNSRSSWVLPPGIGMTAVLLGALYSTAFHSTVVTWCLRKKGPVFVAMFMPLSIVIALLMGVTFLGDSLYLGSVIGTTIVAAGFYSVMWGQAKEKNKLLARMEEDLVVGSEPVLSDQNTPLLSSLDESKYLTWFLFVAEICLDFCSQLFRLDEIPHTALESKVKLLSILVFMMFYKIVIKMVCKMTLLNLTVLNLSLT
uniref:EamA domain, WAT1-related protein n=1 Tax=Tanacetum cinerariifolium TaxID=118510 RepID=A0A6L2KZ57_TANCI|nr:EamA domain, WAT1-related protein [Tanacetum cinerariifolium]